KRGDLEAALADAAGELEGALGATRDAADTALDEAGQTAASLQARGWAERAPAEECERFLAATDGLTGDLGAWLLERNTGGAERHDLLHLVHAPRCAPAFPR